MPQVINFLSRVCFVLFPHFVQMNSFNFRFDLMLSQKQPKISAPYAPEKRDSDTRVVHSIASSLISCVKEATSLKETVQAENQFMETNFQMRISH